MRPASLATGEKPTPVERLVQVQIHHPWAPLLAVGLITLGFGYFASKLALNTRFEVLLPDGQPSVQELHRMEARTPVGQTVLVVLEGADASVLRSMGDALVPRLEALGPEVVSSAQDGIQETKAFLAPRAGLFLSLPELQQLKQDLDDRWNWEVQKAGGFQLLDDDAPPPLTAASLESRFRRSGASGERSLKATTDHYPGGYYQRQDGTALVVVARSPIAAGDLDRVGPALRRIEAAVTEAQASTRGFEQVRVSYAGDMPTGFREYSVVRDDLLSVGGLGVALVLAAVLFYFLRLRALLIMGISIGVGLIWTFGLTELVIGHLNIATAFLISIVAGNGINVGILYQARYFEQRAQGESPPTALRTAVHATWIPTLIAAVAAVGSYGSLMATDFRAFRDFGFIAATGMVLFWVVKTLLVPPLLVLLDPPAPPRWLRPLEMSYGKPFAWLVPKAPAAVVALGSLLALGGSVAGIEYLRRDPMEYRTDAVGNDPRTSPDLQHAWSVANEVLGASQGPTVVLADTPAQAQELEHELLARWDAAPADAKPFVAVHSLWDMVPADQEAKIPLVQAIGERIEKARRHGYLADADWSRLRDLVPPANLRPFTLADLPDSGARPFTERNGTRGTLVLIEAEPNTSNDLHYLLRYADSFRETRLPSGAVLHGSGMAVIFSDILKAVTQDIPIAVSLSLTLTLVAVFLAFRRSPDTPVVLFALLTATAGVASYLYLGNVKLNFLNFAALPITFGIGVDYAVNVAQRYRADGRKDILATLRTSGGAVVLCSLTTLLSYLALLGSHNLGIRSLGSIAAVGELSCLLSAVVLLPSVYLLQERRARRAPEGRAVPSVRAVAPA